MNMFWQAELCTHCNCMLLGVFKVSNSETGEVAWLKSFACAQSYICSSVPHAVWQRLHELYELYFTAAEGQQMWRF